MRTESFGRKLSILSLRLESRLLLKFLSRLNNCIASLDGVERKFGRDWRMNSVILIALDKEISDDCFLASMKATIDITTKPKCFLLI